ncbi:MAG: rhodanese-like domain-containing protein [Elusimicrobia bacterium]|nr:rhodanese-like domain-containing protein [Elusimicrobiota bacterium]
MPATLEKQTHITAVDFFAAKLSFEATPYGLKNAENKDQYFLLDVRNAEAFAQERIPGATNIPLADLVEKLGSLPKDKTIVTYCWHHDCAAAPKAALELAQRGYKVQDLCGGIKAWKEAGYEVLGKK